MIYYPIQTLVRAGIDDIVIVTGGHHAGDFLQLLGNGHEFGLRHLNYAYQEGEGGIAAALKCAESFVDGDRMVVVLGDNIVEKSILVPVQLFSQQKEGARILLKEVDDPRRFGVPIFEKMKLVGIEEKPREPQSTYAVIGIYMYDSKVFDFINALKPSDRGELEITDVNNFYINAGTMEYDMVEGWWSDAGTFESLLYSGQIVSKTGANNF
jgi:glucose-1-phosphate thymidylyltransferase